jgi:LacI family gluconate utilization system Gnt-I transcriptional repressor
MKALTSIVANEAGFVKRRAARVDNNAMPRPPRTRTPAARTARMEDVARAAGVSMITVSRALNTPEKLAPATLRAVRSAIERLRYVPNLTAGSLASNRSRIVGAIVPTVANSIFAETIDGLEQQLAEHGYQLLLGQTHYRPEEEAALVDAFLGRRVDGLVLTGVAHAPGVRARLRRAGIPVVETWDLAARPLDMIVGFSNRAAGHAAACYLAAKGYRSLAFIGGVDDRSEKRLAGFREGARECGASWAGATLLPVSHSSADAARALAGMLAPAAPRAVFCSNDMLAAGVLFECARRRIAVPARLAVMGFADLPIAAGIEPSLTSIQVRATEMGQRAGELLLRRVTGDAGGERVVDLGFAVVERASA